MQGLRSRGLLGHEPFGARSSTRLAFTATVLPKECERGTSVIKAAVTKVFSKRRPVRLRTRELSPLYYAFPVHVACPLPWILYITVNVIVAKHTQVPKY